MNKNRNFRSR